MKKNFFSKQTYKQRVRVYYYFNLSLKSESFLNSEKLNSRRLLFAIKAVDIIKHGTNKAGSDKVVDTR